MVKTKVLYGRSVTLLHLGSTRRLRRLLPPVCQRCESSLISIRRDHLVVVVGSCALFRHYYSAAQDSATSSTQRLHPPDCCREHLLFPSRSRLAAIMDHDVLNSVIAGGQISKYRADSKFMRPWDEIWFKLIGLLNPPQNLQWS
jgi:hypothetical protein